MTTRKFGRTYVRPAWLQEMTARDLSALRDQISDGHALLNDPEGGQTFTYTVAESIGMIEDVLDGIVEDACEGQDK